ncbi:MAG: G1 family glutamic endopeptidase [Candidatus Acidiferrum sp.]
MSQHPLIHRVRFAATPGAGHFALSGLAALLLGAVAIATPAQNLPVAKTVPQKHFTVPPDVPTAIVLQAQPDAACDLHDAGVNDPAQTMKLYGNVEGYVRFHFTPNQDTQDAYLQLDCTAAGVATTYPVHLHVAASPTDDMPAPQRNIPAPAGSTIRPALTEDTAQLLSDEELLAQKYPMRPNAAESPKSYAQWLNSVSHPMTIVPLHAVSRSDISHGSHSPQGTGVTEGVSSGTNDHWSGFVAEGWKNSLRAVEGSWTVPFILGTSSPDCYSSIWTGLDGWVGLDGLASNNVVQAGTEQDAAIMTKTGILTQYYIWTEVWPQEPTAKQIASAFPGDIISVYLYVGDSSGEIDPTGNYVWFTIENETEGQLYYSHTKLGTSFGFTGVSAEWIVERPIVGGYFLELPDYSFVELDGAYVLKNTTWTTYSKAATVQLTMRGNYDAPWYDNNVLSTVTTDAYDDTEMIFYWKGFH